jgi:glutamate---cysteine ligase / carboxylate-amine ligase
VNHAFGRFLTLGVEEELMLVDAREHALASGVSRILPERTERLKTELFECVVETTTTVCDSAEQVLEELRGLRAEVATRAAAAGLALLASGSHPFSRGDKQEIVPEERYRKMKAELGPAVYRQIVCGLHVHVGMPDPETCLRAFEGVLPWLPALLSLSANSPYLEGEEVGPLSGRAGRLAELPRAEAPPVFANWDEWEEFTKGRDYTRMWWDARPHPTLGTLEVRIADQQTDVSRSAAIAALVQALAAEASQSEHEPFDRGAYNRLRAEGAAGGLPLDGLRAVAEPAARRLGTWDEVDGLLAAPAEAERQLAVGRSEGLREVAADLVRRTASERSTV